MSRKAKDLTNQSNIVGCRYGKLVVEKQDDTKSRYYICKCDCGKIKSIRIDHLISAATQSCGCLTSRGEAEIIKILDSLHVTYKTQYSFKDLKSDKNWYLRFDFAIFVDDNLKCLIEYQGVQHYYDYKYPAFGEQQRTITDQMKREYCLKKNIKLFEIKYDEDINSRIYEILQQI